MGVDRTRFPKKLIHVVSGNNSQILGDLQEIRELDREAEARAKFFQKGMILFVVATVAGLFLTSLNPGFLCAVAGGAIGLSFSIARWRAYRKLDLDDDRYLLSERVLKMLDRDRQEKSIGFLKIDLSPPTAPGKKVKESRHPYRTGWKVKTFRDPWLSLRGRFIDNTIYAISLLDRYQIASGWTRSASGKNKHKSKTKFKGTVIVIDLKYRKRRYGAIDALRANLSSIVRLPGFCRVQKIDLDAENLTLVALSTRKDADGLYQTVSAMFLSLYQALNLAKAITSKSP